MAELNHVRIGDELRIPAGTYNAFVDAARAHAGSMDLASGGNVTGTPQTGIVLVRNDTGATRARFDILGVDGVIVTPTNDLAEFQQRVALLGGTPATATDLGRFVVLLEPLLSTEIGRAVVSGVVTCTVNMVSASHGFADVTNAQAGYLTSGFTGSSRILYAEAGTGQKKAVVFLGSGTPLPAGVDGDLLWHNGSAWVVLNKPGGNGTYWLKCVVTAGDPAFSWVEGETWACPE
ncbi:MAG TPA: hypothetical protein VFH61_02330 [Thermoleophilia bacterium]|nr:hypothetical protein [Thermoleophilia bacterium]